MENQEITPEVLLEMGFKKVNKANYPGSELWCYQLKDILLVRWRMNGLFQIDFQQKMKNIGYELKTKSDVESRILTQLHQNAINHIKTQ